MFAGISNYFLTTEHDEPEHILYIIGPLWRNPPVADGTMRLW